MLQEGFLVVEVTSSSGSGGPHGSNCVVNGVRGEAMDCEEIRCGFEGAGSATLSELRTFPVVGVVSSFVEDVSQQDGEDRVLRALLTSGDKLKIGCHCGL